ncbi:MAG: rod shape-determining protein RodA [Clostridia bacterium]|nr:rod shape-determining protein RodA [Clostridia bacterium]
MIAENRRVRAHVDKTLLVLVFAMAVFGVLAVCVATYSPEASSDAPILNHIVESNYAVRQCIFLFMAPFIITVIINIPYDFMRRRTELIYYASTILIFVVWIFNRAEGVKAWLDIIWGFTIQPSEFAKLAMILMMAKTLSRYDRPMSTMKEFIHIMVLLGVPCVIILLSGETGSMMVIAFLVAIMLFFSNVDMKKLFIMAAVVILAVLALYGFMVATGSDDYRLARILAFINPELSPLGDAYQQSQSKMAIGSGGMWGIGMFVDGALSQLNYVPADWTDFIYSTIGEAWGFVGCSIVLLGYLLILLRMLYLARYTRDKFGMLVIIGVMGMLLFHVFENIGMTLGLMPITGIPLPFLSYGGSNMVTNMGGVALVLNVTKNRSLSHSVLTPQIRNNQQYRFSRRI